MTGVLTADVARRHALVHGPHRMADCTAPECREATAAEALPCPFAAVVTDDAGHRTWYPCRASGAGHEHDYRLPEDLAGRAEIHDALGKVEDDG